MPNNLWSNAMTYVDDAAGYARKMVEAEAGRVGSKRAIEIVSRTAGLGYWTVWGLLNKPPKSVAAETWQGLRGAYLAHAIRQARQAHHELLIEAAKDPNDADLQGLVAEAARLVEKTRAATQALRGGR